ncbi:MAG: SipW-dependent-type signal peptide-containing protein [Patescibacteria group bacterium]|jgi:predicted ribosomally synthesized peptide with SipW-like signal peptide
MKKIIISLGIILSIVAVIGITGTRAFLSDSEKSVGNTFTAGAIDLKVDNESYYNGAISQATTFGPSDLIDGKLLINFRDLKPDDEGEDTISLHVNNNDAWLCMDMSLTTNDDISSNEPELGTGDAPEDINNTWDGELADNVRMIWWADDGDNVLEVGEPLLNGGVKTVKDFFGPNLTSSIDLVDATTNVWNPNQLGPAVGGQDYYIGKAWCFGTMAEARVAQDGQGKLPDSTNGPLVRGTGTTCNGAALGNQTQTDGVTMNIAFRAMQARHNTGYTCDTEQRLATITVTKQIINDNGGNNVVGDYQLFVSDGANTIPLTSGVPTVVPVGNYIVTETGVQGYVGSFAGPDCNSVGQITLLEGDSKACTVVNNDLPPNITLIKNVLSGTANPSTFGLKVDGALVQNGSSVAVTSNAPHAITEDGLPGYTFVGPITGTSNYGQSCPTTLGGSITLAEGEAIVCTINNALTP